jgi:hypothetical protein
MTDRCGGHVHAMRPEKRLVAMDALASERSIPMLRKTMIVLATAAALTAGLTADAFARGGGGGGHMGGGGHIGGGGMHMGGGFAGAHMGRGFGGPHMGGGFGGPRMGGGFRPHFAGRGRFGGGDLGLYDDSCNYPWPYYNPDLNNCYLN